MFAGPNQDVIIIAVVCTVLALLIICAVGVGVAGFVVLRQRHIHHTSSPYDSVEDHKYPTKTDCTDDHDTGTFYLMTVTPQTKDDEDTIDSPVGSLESGVKLPDGTQCGDSTPATPRELDSGFQSVTECSLEEGEGISSHKVGSPNIISNVNGKGGHGSPEEDRPKRPGSISLKQKGCDRDSMLDTELFRGGLTGGKSV